MIQIHVLSGAKAGARSVACRLPFWIGRSARDDLRLDDPGVWERHARLELRDRRHAVLVASPDATTVINGHTVPHALLRNGDVIELGSVRLQFSLGPTRHRSLRLRETLTWIALAALSLGQVALIYCLAEAEAWNR